jgi:hypothetical protein
MLRPTRRQKRYPPHDYGGIVAMGAMPFMPDEFNACKEIGAL